IPTKTNAFPAGKPPPTNADVLPANAGIVLHRAGTLRAGRPQGGLPRGRGPGVVRSGMASRPLVSGRHVAEPLHLLAMRLDRALHLLARERLAPFVDTTLAEEPHALPACLDEAVLLFHRGQALEARMPDRTLDARAVLSQAHQLRDLRERLGGLL